MAEKTEMFAGWDRRRKNGCYYPAISCVQKAVRRNRYDLAIAPALVAFRLEPFRFGRRLHTILFEEAARDYGTIHFMYENWDSLRKTEDGIAEVVRRLCEAKKTREACLLMLAGLKVPGNPEDPMHNVWIEARDFLGKDMVEQWGIQEAFGYSSVLDWFAKQGIVLPEWLARMLTKCIENKMDPERHGFYVPYLWAVDQADGERPTYDDPAPANVDDDYDGLFLLSGLDMHTSPGKMVLNKSKKKGICADAKADLGDLLWYLSSACMKNMMPISYSEDHGEFYPRDREERLGPDDFAIFDEALGDYNRFRSWAAEKMAGDFVDVCRKIQSEIAA